MQEKTSGIKLHIGVDILGFSHLIMITTADVTDHNGAIDMVDYYCENTENLYYVKKILVDEGYTGQNFAVIPKRSFGLSNKCRLLWKNCERLLKNSFQIFFSCFYSYYSQKILNRLL